MNNPHSRFQSRLLLSFAALILLLGAGIFFVTRQLQNLADEEIAVAKAREALVTAAEQLRWAFTAEIAAARGYLLTGNASALRPMEEAEKNFRRLVGAIEASHADEPLLAEVKLAAQEYRTRLVELIEQRRQGVPEAALNAIFERELLPARNSVVDVLDEFARQQSQNAERYYTEAALQRHTWRVRSRALTTSLMLLSIFIAAYFARRLGQAYRQEQELRSVAQSALAWRDEMIGILAHDLRNPLTAISLTASVIESGSDKVNANRHAAEIVHLAMRMSNLIRDMLDSSTLDAGKLVIDAKPCSVADLLQATSNMFLPQAAAKQVLLHVEAAPELVAMADIERTLQVLSNLVGNALKFTPQGGRVSVSAACQGAWVRFEVSDTGPGIEDKHLPRLFDRFWTEAAGQKGTGLGLYVAKGIIDAHGGEIRAGNRPEGGATFAFTLPLAMQTPA